LIASIFRALSDLQFLISVIVFIDPAIVFAIKAVFSPQGIDLFALAVDIEIEAEAGS